MRGMIKRWLRRRLDFRATHLETSLDDEDRERGDLVRKGHLVALRTHVPANREAFQRWYADREIAELLRHDLEPLTPIQSRGYFDTFILPSSARGTCFAIHERKSKRLIGTTALTDRMRCRDGVSALFRIVIGEIDVWGRGYGTEATRLMAEEAFENMGLSEIRLEVFNHNQRAIAAYSRVGFQVSGDGDFDDPAGNSKPEQKRQARQQRRNERRETRMRWKADRTGQLTGSGQVSGSPEEAPALEFTDPD